MKKSIFYKILSITVLTVALLYTSFICIAQFYNIQTAKTYTENILNLIKADITNGENQNQKYQEIVQKFRQTDVRISIIDKDGTVLADTIRPNIDANPFDNHRERSEIQKATVPNKTAHAIRKSDSHGDSFLYSVKKFDEIFIRVGLKLHVINQFLLSFMISSLIITIIIVCVIMLVVPLLIKKIIRPFELIKNNLERIIAGKEIQKMYLSSHDDINIILNEINTISALLNETVHKYQNEKEKLASVLDTIEQGVIALNKNKKVIFTNNFLQTLIGSFAKNASHLIEILRDAGLENKITSEIDLNRYALFDYEILGRVLEIAIIPVAGGGKPNEIASLIKFSDVTQIRRLTREKQDFFINASHELNTPLTSVLGYSELLNASSFDDKEKIKDFANKINKEANRMKALVSDMLLLSKTEGNWNEFIDEKIDLATLTNTVLESFSIKIKEKNITLISKIDQVSIFASVEKITEVISNLIDNAVKYTKKDGTIEIILKEENQKIIFSISDTGVGIPEKYINRVFERFFRAKNMKDATGTGLGLTIVKNICTHYNAEISLKSTEAIGSEFVISFRSATK
ncbi:MAG: sensor histidine kinase [Treponemataceae bacterium]